VQLLLALEKFLATCAQDTSHILAFALAPP